MAPSTRIWAPRPRRSRCKLLKIWSIEVPSLVVVTKYESVCVMKACELNL